MVGRLLNHTYIKEERRFQWSITCDLDAYTSRGSYHTEFNGTIFNIDNPNNTKKEKESKLDIPDPFNAWGLGEEFIGFRIPDQCIGQCFASGDYDMMLP